MKLVTIVTPCYNEEKTIPIFLSTLDPILSSIEGYKFQYLFVNDGSKDKTLEVLEEAYSKRDDITIVN
ncbi:MAG: glycosyltransferase, partial [Mollicutes bacterium]|nr:glycosyltransferase [Mollicutes bacterium]